MSEVEKARFKALRSAFNKNDSEIGLKYLIKHGFADANGVLTPNGKNLLKIEKLADIVDRGMDPTSSEEFGKKIVRASESKYLKSQNGKKMAAVLEGEYFKTTKGLSLREHKNIMTKFITKSLPLASRIGVGTAKFLSSRVF